MSMNDAQSNTPVNPYLRTKVMTASPEELRLMLYDGAIKFCRQATDAMGKGQWEAMYNALIRAQKIVMEMSNSMKPELAPELCERMSALYTYLYKRLVDANLERDRSPIDEVIGLLEYERETWLMVVKQVAAEQGGEAGASGGEGNPVGRIGPDDPAEMPKLSIQG